MSTYTIHRLDNSQKEIVKALEAAGWEVFTRMPCDMFCYKAGVWKPLEAKTPKNKRGDPRLDKRQARQAAFLTRTGTPVVTTPVEALKAIGYYEKPTFTTTYGVQP